MDTELFDGKTLYEHLADALEEDAQQNMGIQKQWIHPNDETKEQNSNKKQRDDYVFAAAMANRPHIGPIVTRLTTGDFHICKGHRCEHITIDGDRQLVCGISGIVVGSDYIQEHDPQWTGRSTTSGDPDIVGGVPQGGWRPRKDAFTESQRAFEASKLMSSEEVVYKESAKEIRAREARSAVKRGAICVDQEEDRDVAAFKRSTCTKRTNESQETTDKLKAEAALICEKLTTPLPSSSSSSSSSASKEDSSNTGSGKPKHDIRLQSVQFVNAVFTQRYIKSCASGNDTLSMTKLHDILVKSTEFAKMQRKIQTAEASRSSSCRAGFSGQVKSEVSSLIIALWRACCTTRYLKSVRRGTDSFRPFCCGVLYSLKRGMTIEQLGSLEIIPSIPILASNLPTLRSVDASAVARQLQSSSHRGVCTLHRSISSFVELEPDTEEFHLSKIAFETAARVGAQLLMKCRAR